MLIFLLILHCFLAVVIIGLVVLQKTEEEGFGGGSSMGGIMNIRGAANFLTRFTAIIATIFMSNCLLIGRIYTTDHKEMREKLLNGSDNKAPLMNDNPNASQTAIKAN